MKQFCSYFGVLFFKILFRPTKKEGKISFGEPTKHGKLSSRFVNIDISTFMNHLLFDVNFSTWICLGGATGFSKSNGATRSSALRWHNY